MVLFVGNLSYNATNKDLLKLFAPFGIVEAAQIITDNITRRSRGFAYVNMEDKTEADNAIQKLNNTKFMDKVIVVTDQGPRHPVRSSFTPVRKK